MHVAVSLCRVGHVTFVARSYLNYVRPWGPITDSTLDHTNQKNAGDKRDEDSLCTNKTAEEAIMHRLLLLLLLIWGCAGPTPPTCCTIRDPSMTSVKFFELADAMVRENFPLWYAPDVKKELLFNTNLERYASVSKIEDGTFVMSIYKSSWDLCAVEDLALVLLHEYTHVLVWNRLKESIPNEDCRSAVHELFANQAELYQVQVRGTLTMRRVTQFAYTKHYLLAQTYCPEGTADIFPEPEVE